MQITLIRHLPTRWNKQTLLQGKQDIGIDPISKSERGKIAGNLQYLKRYEPFDLVLASTLKRTKQTAALYGYEAIEEPLLDELDFGPFEGMPRKKLLEAHEVTWLEDPKTLILGESMPDFWDRIKMFIEKYKYMGSLLVFGHGSWIRALKSYERYGHMNNMNQLTVENNSCFTIMLDM